MAGLKSLAFCVILFAVAVCGCSEEDPVESTSIQEARSFIAEHWSVDLLIAAYNPESTDSERAGEGEIYFPMFDSITDSSNISNLPLWVSEDEDEQEYMRNAAIWNQFIFGWDDYLKASEARPQYEYEPTYTRADLNQFWVSENLKEFRRILNIPEHDPEKR